MGRLSPSVFSWQPLNQRRVVGVGGRTCWIWFLFDFFKSGLWQQGIAGVRLGGVASLPSVAWKALLQEWRGAGWRREALLCS